MAAAGTASPPLLSSLIVFLLISATAARTASFRPRALVLAVTKDSSTSQYITRIQQRTPLTPLALTVDLGGQSLWVDCETGYVSSSYHPAQCRTAICALARSAACGECFSPPKPGCNNNTCGALPANTVTNVATSGEVAYDVVSVPSTDGSNPGRTVLYRRLVFTCGSIFLLEGLAGGVKGMAGLGRSRVSMPAQLSAGFSIPRKFALCLPFASTGVLLIGDGPYNFLPGIDVSKNLIYTPLILNPVSSSPASFSGDPSTDYFIGLRSILVDNKPVILNSTLLSINREGFGGTKLSTVHRYTAMQTSIHDAVTSAFLAALSGVPRVPATAGFKVCFNSRSVGSTRTGPAVPVIDLVLKGGATWRIFGANSMVAVGKHALCVGVVDGGIEPRTAIVIGGHQLQDNLLQFDLAKSRLGFSSTLLFRQTTCSNFNFTAKP